MKLKHIEKTVTASEYCKICKLFESCGKAKTCSCERYEPRIVVKHKHK